MGQEAKSKERAITGQGKPPAVAFAVHETAMVDTDCRIGKGTRIGHSSRVLPNCRIGENCDIGENVVIGPDVTIGKGCTIQDNVSICKGITLEDWVFCGPSTTFTNFCNPRTETPDSDEIRPTLIKHNATLGAYCIILCGTTIGKYGFIGAGAMVTLNVPDQALMLGNPARRAGWVCRCGERLTDSLDCPVCKKTYSKKQEGLLRVFREDPPEQKEIPPSFNRKNILKLLSKTGNGALEPGNRS